MSDHLRLHALGAVTITLFFVLAMAAPAAAFPVEAPTTEPDTSEPPTTEPDTSEPSTSEPATPAPDDVEDDGIDIGAAVLGVLGFTVLIGIAAWWMVRLGNLDDAPHPRPPPLDAPSPGQDLL